VITQIKAIKLPVVVGLGFVISLVVLFFINPADSGVFPDCPSRVFFGVDCPGCGGLRGTHSLLHGDVSMAINQNVLLLGAYPMAVSLWFLWIVQVWKQHDLLTIFRPYSRVIVGAGLFILIGFTIVRNMIPGLEWGSGA
jgi:hypothetical protein